ncbi:protein KHNYN [Brienomyrus brachyistius]|uniref:protein KHNYN n=1 Tax=Brienomyrus brachyistius TaxID=42636 RepID=UPI0020B3FE6F|nr:protein KHNYN [Brienomyrus brachyistius]
MASAEFFIMSGGQKEEEEKAEDQLEDEFACPEAARGLLQSVQPMVERVFAVSFVIGTTEKQFIPQNEHIWVKMRGGRTDVEAAKLFVKGLTTQEVQQEVTYPKELHCVFSGARGLFMDCLIKNTSAHVVVGSSGSLLLSGLTVPVGQAYSFIYNLVEKYKSSKGLNNEVGSGSSDESQGIKQAFEAMVERWENRYALELLDLPGAVKEILLNLVRESRLDTLTEDRDKYRQPERATSTHTAGDAEWLRKGCHNFEKLIHMEGGMEQSSDQAPRASSLHRISPFRPTHFGPGVSGESKGWQIGKERMGDGKVSVEKEPRNPLFCIPPRDVGHQERLAWEEGPHGHMPQEVGEEDGPALSVGSREEIGLQLNFFTAMGYSEDVVRKILARTGPKEVSQILDLVQQEQDKVAEERMEENPQTATVNAPLDVKWEESSRPAREDFVLGVLKEAAAKCGFSEEKVMEVYSNLPGLSTGELLEELHKDAQRAKGGEKGRQAGDKKERGCTDPQRNLDFARISEADGKAMVFKERRQYQGRNEMKQDQEMGECFPELHTMSGEPVTTNEAASCLPNSCIHIQGPPESTYPLKILPSFKKHPHDRARSREQNRPHDTGTETMVTGEQRFHDGLQKPFELKLTDDPGDPSLRHVIIDGSNLAMTHGLGHFFSCRGIALAVQYFWNQGHRKVTVFVPQFRMKKDPKVKEKHYLTELQNLGLLSFTPSREVDGMRFTSYDDRFLLHLAQGTDGVIVTKDNLRDLADESPAWRDIIKNRLLQYTFVGDLFMVPDDPLGRGGPHLKDFLRSQHRSPVPGSHTFAGLASSPHASSSPHAQTDVIQYRDHTMGSRSFWPVAPERGRGRGRGKGRGGIRRVSEGEGIGRERTTAETSRLREELSQVFQGQDSVVTMALSCNPCLNDINSLSHIILELLAE